LAQSIKYNANKDSFGNDPNCRPPPFEVPADPSDPNSGTCTVNVEIVDITKPEITLIGFSEVVHTIDTPYTDLGASVSDNDKATPTFVSGVGFVDITSGGTYVLTYDITDPFGNMADTVLREVFVDAVDNLPPIITAPELNVILPVVTDPPQVQITNVDEHDELGCIVTDNDSGYNEDCTFTGGIDTTIRTVQSVTFDAPGDLAGNPAASVFVEAEIVDTIRPVITIIGDNPMVLVNGTDSYVEEGASVTDNDNLTPSTAIIGGFVNDTVIGTYSITYNISDSGLAAFEKTRIVEVINPIDDIKIQVAELNTKSKQLSVEATSNNPDSVLTVCDNTPQCFGDLTDNGDGTYEFKFKLSGKFSGTIPLIGQPIIVSSQLGGGAEKLLTEK